VPGTSSSRLALQISDMFRLRDRQLRPEIMDDPALDFSRHEKALQGLTRLNMLGQSARLIWPTISTLSRNLGRKIRVLDIATGGGDIPIALASLARRYRLPIDFDGCDVSPRAVAYARQKASRTGIQFFVHDALSQRLPTGYDVLMCSLFLHHLDVEQARMLLRGMADACRQLLIVSDLNRSPSTMFLTCAASLLATRSDVVHVDGPLSAQAAFTVTEARQLAQQAGLQDCKVHAAWPCRFLLTWSRALGTTA
jgi:2-polyprenyl-3-methyl-5-hydroxy-6-metoxy-1,4-benzoquinol methylase